MTNFPQKNYLESTKMAIAVCKFSKISPESMPPDPLRVAFVTEAKLLKLNLSKKLHWKIDKIGAPP